MAKTLEEWINTDVQEVRDKPIVWLSQYHFFRDPSRLTYLDSQYFFSPADGIILYQQVVEPDECLLDIKGKSYSLRDAIRDESYSQKSLVIGVFMTFFDVHVNRIPYSGRLSYRELDPIDTLNHPMLDVERALLDELRIPLESAGYLHHNQRMVNTIIYASQLSQYHQRAQGERFSQIRYGSQVDLIAPLSERYEFNPIQQPGYHIEAGLDPLVRIGEKQSERSRVSIHKEKEMNPTQLQRPAFLMNAPFSYSTAEANNVWMQEMTEAERIPDRKRSMVQFLKLYNFLAAEALVYLLPIPRIEGLQDLVFTANLGIVLEHVEGKNTVVISNYSSAPRQGETE